jgi:hypothetical protein
MSTYLVTWEEAIIHAVHIEAESEQDALDKFNADDYDYTRISMVDSTGIIEGSQEAEEV